MKLFLLLMWNAPYFYHTSKMIFNDFTLLFSIQFWYPNCLKEPNPSSEIWIRLMNLLTYESKAENTKFWWHPKTISSWLWFKIRLSLWKASRKKGVRKGQACHRCLYWDRSLGKSVFLKEIHIEFLSYFFVLCSKSLLELA